jgi:predicted DCC family thiol-disulfide oxidoreductase YuxK
MGGSTDPAEHRDTSFSPSSSLSCSYPGDMTGTLLYDADCGFCTRVARWLPTLRLPIEIMSMQSVDLGSYGVDPDHASEEIPFVAAGGRVFYGHAAFAAALRTATKHPLALVLRALGYAMIIPGLSFALRQAYRWLAAHRHQLPGGTAACELRRRDPVVPPAGFEPALPPPEGGALSPELRGRRAELLSSMRMKRTPGALIFGRWQLFSSSTTRHLSER